MQIQIISNRNVLEDKIRKVGIPFIYVKICALYNVRD